MSDRSRTTSKTSPAKVATTTDGASATQPASVAIDFGADAPTSPISFGSAPISFGTPVATAPSLVTPP